MLLATANSATLCVAFHYVHHSRGRDSLNNIFTVSCTDDIFLCHTLRDAINVSLPPLH